MERRVTPAKRVTSLTWGHPPPCKQALNKANVKIISYLALQVFFFQMLPWSLGCWSAPFCPESLRLLPALDHHELYDESANCSGNRRNILPDQGDWKREEVHVLPLKRSFALTHYMWMRKKPFCNEELPLWRDQSSISRIRSVVAVWLIISRAFSPETWSNTRSIVTRHGCFLAQIMPSSNLLSFLRPLYDIAVWQFILILGFKVERRRIGRLKFIWKMHQVVANFVCKLLEARPFDHLKARMEEAEVKTATEGWKPGDRLTKRMIKLCQDQWWRKDPAHPKENCAFSVNEPCTMPWFNNMPVCFNCGVPCPECGTELGEDIPPELSTALALLHFGAVREESSEEDGSTEPREVTSRMTLRSSRKE